MRSLGSEKKRTAGRLLEGPEGVPIFCLGSGSGAGGGGGRGIVFDFSNKLYFRYFLAIS